MSTKKMSWWRRRLRKAGRERGMVEAGIAAAGGLLVVGAVVGNGVAAAAMDMSDGQTWLGGDDGSVVQINPATGQPEYRLVIGGDGDRMEVTQNDGLLVVTNLETGVVTAIDLAGLVAGQGRQTDGETIVLVGGGHVMLAEMEPGFVQVVDPLTMASLGAPYRAGVDLSDAVIDGDGTVWLMTETGELRELDWLGEEGEFSVSLERPVAGAGPGTRLVPHASGVTVFAPDGGAVLQIGVGADYVQQVPALQGEVQAAKKSPADLAPASATDAGLVFMISGRQLLTVDVAGIGCVDPLRPAVFERRVYVPCGGEGRVIVLDENGGRAAGPDIIVPGGGDPELTVDDGRLFVHDPEDGRIVIVQQDGSTTVTDVDGAEIPTGETEQNEPLPPVSTGTTTPPPGDGSTTPPVHIDPPFPPDPTQDPTDDPTDTSTGGGGSTDDPTDDPTDGSTDGGGSTDGTDGDEDLAPSDVTAVLDADGTVVLSWTPAVVQPDGYVVTSSDGGSQTVAAGRTSVRLTSLTCGTTIRLTVYGQHGDQMVGAGTDVETAACVNPPEPEELTPRSVVSERAGEDVVVGWTAPAVTPDRYVVTGMGQTRTVSGTATSVVLPDVACGVIEVEVTAVHTEAGEYSANGLRTTESCAPETTDPADLQPRTVTLTRVTGNDYRLTWQSPVVAPESYQVTGNGVNESVAAGTHQLDVTIACVATVRLTVTANHADGSTSPVQSNPLTNTCTTTTTPPTLTAPTNVTATYDGDNRVVVSWNASSPAADEYVVIPSGGGGTVSTTGSPATVTVARGADYTFTVEARLTGAEPVTSARSNSVNVPAPQTAPAAPGGVSGSYVSHSGTSSVTISVSWTAPADGGSPITGYRVTPSGGSTVTVTGTSTQVTVPCSGSLCTTGGSVNVSVAAVNGVGPGPAGTGSASVPANTSIPQNGDGVLVSSTNMNENSGMISASIEYQPSAAWANFSGTCTVTRSGGSSEVIPCGTPATVWTGFGHATAGVYGEVSITASGGGHSATSSGSVFVSGQYWCPPDGGPCQNPVSLDDPDVEIDNLPWTPPEPPNPPVLVAGIGLLLGAGTMRTLRALRRRGLFETPAQTHMTDREKEHS